MPYRQPNLWYCLCCLLVLILQPDLVRAATATSSASGVSIARIDAFVRDQMDENDFPGVALALVHGDRLVHLRGFGEAAQDGRPVTPQTPFILGSVSKAVTAVAVMQLVEAGKVALDAPVTRYLPWFRLSDAHASRRITVRQLLAHTSGIPPDAGMTDTTLSALHTTSIEHLVRSFRTVALDRPVGSSFEYADANYIVVSLIVQAVSGEPYGAYLQRHIFAPLQMHHSFTSEQAAQQHGLAQGFTSWFGIPWPVEEPYLPVNLAAGYTISSAEDMAHLLIAEMNGGRFGRISILSLAGVTAMHQRLDPRFNYGMGWFLDNLNGSPVYSHDGATLRFHAYVLIEPRQRWAAVLLVNQESLIASPALEHLQEGLAALLSGHEPPTGGLDVRTLALIVDGVLVLVLAGIIFPLLRLPRWYRRRKDGRRLGVLTYVRVVGEVSLPLLVVLGLSLLGLPWTDQFVAAPDYTVFFLAALGIVFMTGCVRAMLIILVQWRRSGNRSSPESSVLVASGRSRGPRPRRLRLPVAYLPHRATPSE
jgi:CubicO group peptidase (beta-lactamase class C family)